MLSRTSLSVCLVGRHERGDAGRADLGVGPLGVEGRAALGPLARVEGHRVRRGRPLIEAAASIGDPVELVDLGAVSEPDHVRRDGRSHRVGGVDGCVEILRRQRRRLGPVGRAGGIGVGAGVVTVRHEDDDRALPRGRVVLDGADERRRLPGIPESREQGLDVPQGWRDRRVAVGLDAGAAARDGPARCRRRRTCHPAIST